MDFLRNYVWWSFSLVMQAYYLTRWRTSNNGSEIAAIPSVSKFYILD